MFRLSEGVSHTAFLKKVQECVGEVLFENAEGDVLNLKSMLSQFVFAASFLRPEIVRSAQVLCAEPEDYRRLRDYLTETEG